MLKREELRDYIKKRGLKQKYVAEKVGLTERDFCWILSGKRKCEVGEYSRICIFLGVPFEEFLYQPIIRGKGGE